MFLSDGIMEGCAITYTATGITVGVGHFVAAGRRVYLPVAETINLLNPISTGFVRLKLKIDLTQTASKDIFTQGSWVYDYSTTLGGFPALTQENINAPGTAYNTYEIEFAVLSLSGSVITGVTRSISGAYKQKTFSGRLAAASVAIASGGSTVIPIDTTDYNDTGFSLDASKRLVLPSGHGFVWVKIWANARIEGRATTHVLSIGGTALETGVSALSQIYGSTGAHSGLSTSQKLRLKSTGGLLYAAVEQYSGSNCSLYSGSGWCAEFSKH